jgi:mannose-6-phosphate isomerase-like protein (cupin superfamily)
MPVTKIVSINNGEHYNWGQNNDGWHLLKNDALSVIEESMLPGTSEQLHFHQKAQQLFYILSGKAGFKIDQQLLYLVSGESVHIPPEIPHLIFNNGDAVLRFIVVSSPKSHGDREEVAG